jgi:hypothetical protein
VVEAANPSSEAVEVPRTKAEGEGEERRMEGEVVHCMKVVG